MTVSRTGARAGTGKGTTFRLIAPLLICLKYECFTFRLTLLLPIPIPYPNSIPEPSLIAFFLDSVLQLPQLLHPLPFHAKQKLILAKTTRIFTLNKFLVWFVPLTDCHPRLVVCRGLDVSCLSIKLSTSV